MTFLSQKILKVSCKTIIMDKIPYSCCVDKTHDKIKHFGLIYYPLWASYCKTQEITIRVCRQYAQNKNLQQVHCVAFCAMLPGLISTYTPCSGHTHTNQVHRGKPHVSLFCYSRTHIHTSPWHKQNDTAAGGNCRYQASLSCLLSRIRQHSCVPGLPLSSSIYSIYNQHPVSCVTKNRRHSNSLLLNIQFSTGTKFRLVLEL